jgi:hypothetical protein
MPRDHRPHHALTGEQPARRAAARTNPATGIAGDTAVQRSARHRQRARSAGANPAWAAFYGDHRRGVFTLAPRPGDVRWPAGAELGQADQVKAAERTLLAQAVLMVVLRHVGAVLFVLGLIIAGAAVMAWALLRTLALAALLLVADRPVGRGFNDDLF